MSYHCKGVFKKEKLLISQQSVKRRNHWSGYYRDSGFVLFIFLPILSGLLGTVLIKYEISDLYENVKHMNLTFTSTSLIIGSVFYILFLVFACVYVSSRYKIVSQL